MFDLEFPIVWRSPISQMLIECSNLQGYSNVNLDKEYTVETKVISPNPLQNLRFTPIKGSIFIQNSSSTEVLIQELKNQGLKEDTTLMVRGPAGTGKSFALLHLILNLRKQSLENETKMLRFLYINNPTNMAENWHKYIIDEMVYTMAPDIKHSPEELKPYLIKTQVYPHKSISDDLEEKRNMADETTAEDLIKNYANFCKQKRFFFVLVIDQYKQFEDKLANALPPWFQKLPQHFNMRIYGRSDTSDSTGSVADNEIFIDTKFSVKQGLIYLTNKVEWIPKLLESLPKKDDPNIEDNLDEHPKFKQLYDSTQFMPLELEMFTQVVIQNPDKDFNEIYQAFLNRRYGDVCEMNTMWLKNYSFLRNDDCAKFVYNMNVGITHIKELPSAFFNNDPNLFYKYKLGTETHIRFTSRIVEHCMYKIWSKESRFWRLANEILWEHRDLLRKIINMHFSKNGSKGNMFQKYFETMMRLGSSYQPQTTALSQRMADMYRLSFNDIQKTVSQLSFIDIKKFIPFEDSELLGKLQGALDAHGISVLVPNSLSCAYVDFILVDPTNAGAKIIYVIQCTINITSHKKVDMFMDRELAKLGELKQPVTDQALKDAAQPISQCLFRIKEKDSGIKHVFLWVGLARVHDKEEYFNATDPLFAKSIVHKDSQVALVTQNPTMFQDLAL
jgi:hypothetical protein